MRKHFQILAIIAIVISAFCIDAKGELVVVVDFEDRQATTGLSFLTINQDGLELTIDRSSGEVFDLDQINTSPFFLSLSPFNQLNGAATNDVFRIELSRPVTSISVDFGDFGADADSLYIQAHQNAGLQGDFVANQGSLFGGGDQFGFQTLTVNADNRVPEFRSFYISGGGNDFRNSVFYDNFRFTVSVPEPNSLILVGLGLSIALQKRRRLP